ncbi:insecticyanin-A-like [Battus philenor]|uniref:insecticyanin-A-like n=1 Tax=Battus philenor TaxID=42288 RepID=UPI0035CEB396
MTSIKYYAVLIVTLANLKLCTNQVLQFGPCVERATVKFFDVENFLGLWYEIERFPTWYEGYTQCAYRRFQACGRRIEIEHSFVRDNVRFILHVNSSYAPGDEAIFKFKKNNLDPIGIPLTVIATDYKTYAVTYGCRNDENLDIKYISASILSREKTLAPEILEIAYKEVNSLPYASTVYLEPVEHDKEKCSHHWTAHVNAENTEEDEYESLC